MLSLDENLKSITKMNWRNDSMCREIKRHNSRMNNNHLLSFVNMKNKNGKICPLSNEMITI